MRPVLQFATSVLMLGGLLFQATSHAVVTSLAEQPLKASVLAKPNVIFGMDDSGSMDFEVMLYSSDGAFWWYIPNQTSPGSGSTMDTAHPNVSMRTVTGNRFNSNGAQNANWRKMAYLFPNGHSSGATSDQRKLADSANDHFAILPTSEFAHMRWSGVYKDGDTYVSAPTDPAASPAHNPLYYNPLVTYKPWSDARLTGGTTNSSYTNATPSAARSHPVFTGSTFNLTATRALSISAHHVFTALPGMTIPAGSQKNVCSWSNGTWTSNGKSLCDNDDWEDQATDDTAVNGKVTRVAMAYYPATYWVKEPCTADAENVANKACIKAPDGSWLKRYEIKSGNTFPSGRGYEAELQNFANWFQYYRKRKLMLAAAMGQTMETLNGMRLGVVRFNSHSNVSMYDADSTDDTANRLRLAGIFYENVSNGGTPTGDTLDYIGKQYTRTDPDAKTGQYVVQYACQRNNAFIVTDGFANYTGTTWPAYTDGDKDTYGSGVPYETTHDKSLADLALRLYTNNPRPTLTKGMSPTTTRDTNKNLHVNTYGLTLGARGVLLTSNSTPEPTSASAWVNWTASHNPVSIDDLWHATINGRGRMYLATTPEETALRIRAGLEDIKSEEGAQSSVAVSTFNLLASDGKAYEASYNPAGWVGDLTASPVNMTTGAISNTPTWSASTLLTARDWTNRVIFTSNAAGTGIGFTDANIGATVNPSLVTFPDSADVVNYLRGKRDGEGSKFRTRTSLMGAVINAEPVIDGNGVVYVASSEGMMHAFNTATGAEEWAFVPYPALAEIGKTVQREYSFKTKLDGTPTIGRYTDGGDKLLVAGMGAAGRGYYALDVTNPKGLSEAGAAAQVKWRFPSTATATHQANVGYTVGRPLVVKTANNGYVVLVTSGYDNGESIGDGKGRMWMLNASTGAVIREFTTTYGGVGSEAGLSQIAAYRENTGTARYAYAGDLLGNLWKFDLDTGATTLLTTLMDASNNPQPVTTAPQLTRINGKPVIMVATGRLLDITDFGNSKVQSVYAVVDDGSGTLASRSNMDPLTHNTTDQTITGIVHWDTKRGWYVDLPANEHVNVDPKFALGWLYVNANSAGGTNCAQGASGYKIFVRSGSGVSDSLSATSNATSPVLVQLEEGALIRWTRLNNSGIKNDKSILSKTYAPRRNSWRDSR